MKQRLITTILLGIVIAAVMSFLYIKSLTPNAQRNVSIRDQLMLVKHVDFELNETLFDVASNRVSHYDYLMDKQQELLHVAETLAGEEYGLGFYKNSEFNKLTIRLLAAIRQKNTMIEKFKRNHAVLQNSLRHYPGLSHAIGELYRNDSSYRQFEQLAHAIMAVVVARESDELGIARTQIIELKQWLSKAPTTPGSSLPMLSNFLAHSEIILNGIESTHNVPDILHTIPVDLLINELYDQFGEIYSKQIESAEFYGRLLFIASLLLIGVIAYILVLLARGNMQLARQTGMAHAANVAKSAFLANMSHEIRTPLTAIIGFGESSLDSRQTREERFAALHAIVRNGKHLLQIINEILDISKIESGKLEIERIPAGMFEVMYDVDSVMRVPAETKGLKFEVDYQYPLPAKIITDPIRFKQILFNLINNAIKFTERGSVIIKVGFDPEERKLLVTVCDTGIGLTQEQLDRLFQPFTQADSSIARKYGGSGLGLHISKALSEMLGGELQVESIHGMGSKFSFSIDTGSIDSVDLVHNAREVIVAHATHTGPVGIPRLRGRILLAEDNPDNQKLIAFYVRKTGAELAFAENGESAVNQAGERPFDLILMDVQMPVMDGLKATRKLRATGYHRPIVALTANAGPEDMHNSQQAGCDGFLSKPIDWSTFFQTLAQYLDVVADAGQNQSPIISTLLKDEPDMADLIANFLNGLPDWMQRLSEAYQQRDQPSVAAILHQIKGMCGNYGFKDLSEFVEEMETDLRQHGLAAINDSMDELETLFERMRQGAPATVDSD